MDTSISTLENLLARVQKNRASQRLVTTPTQHAAAPATPPEQAKPLATDIDAPHKTSGERDIRDPGATLHGLPAMFTPTTNDSARNASTGVAVPAMQPMSTSIEMEPKPLETKEKAASVPMRAAAEPPVAHALSQVEKRAIVSETPTLTGAPTFASDPAPAPRRTFGSMLENSLGLRLRK